MADEETTENSVDADTQASQDSTAPEGEQGQQTSVESDTPKGRVPYERFEEVVRQKNTYKEQLQQMAQQSQGKQKAPVKTEEGEIDWDALAKSSSSWNDFVSKIQEASVQRLDQHLVEKEEQAEEAFNQEVESLHEAGLVENQEEEDAVIKFAYERSKELGQRVPLKMAAKWMQDMEEAVPEAEKNLKRKEVSGKIQSSQKSTGEGPQKSKEEYDKFRGKSLDEVVLEAKQGLPESS